MRSRPWATLGAARAPPGQEPGARELGPRVGVGARRGMEAAGLLRAYCMAAARSICRATEALASAGTWGIRPSWPPMYTPKERNWPRWRLEDSADPFLVRESRSSFQRTCLGVNVSPWFVTGHAQTLRVPRKPLLSRYSQNQAPLQPGNPRANLFAVWHAVGE